MNKFQMLHSELEELKNNVPFTFFSDEGLQLKYMIISLQHKIGFGTGALYSKDKNKEIIKNAIPMISAKIQEVNSDIEHGWFFKKEFYRTKRDILVKIYNYMNYIIDLLSKSE